MTAALRVATGGVREGAPREPGDASPGPYCPERTCRQGPALLTPDWVAVCRLEDIVPNTGICALLDDRQVAVFRLDDESLYAIDNYDPFSGANVLSRGIVGDLKGERVVASPVYKQHFSLVTGQCLEDASVRVPAYSVRLDGSVVWVRGAA